MVGKSANRFYLLISAFILIFLISSFFFSPRSVYGAEIYEYPELMVIPKASDTLAREAADESRSQRMQQFIPLQISAAFTLWSGYRAMQENSDKEDKRHDAYIPGVAATAVGAGWLGITTAIAAFYQPYRTGLADIQKYNGKSKADQLTRERLAEERLAAPASLGTKLKYLSVTSNLIACGAIAATSDDDNSKIVAAIGVMAAFTPLVFSHRWNRVFDNHENYKKKIYGPITSAIWLQKPGDNKLLPGISLALVF